LASCQVTNGSGRTVGATDVTDVQVSCTPFNFQV
jgi:hypothetical protein